MDAVRENVEILNDRLNTHREMLKLMRGQIGNLERMVNLQASMIDDLKACLTDIESHVEGHRGRLIVLENKVSDL